MCGILGMYLLLRISIEMAAFSVLFCIEKAAISIEIRSIGFGRASACCQLHIILYYIILISPRRAMAWGDFAGRLPSSCFCWPARLMRSAEFL